MRENKACDLNIHAQPQSRCRGVWRRFRGVAQVQ